MRTRNPTQEFKQNNEKPQINQRKHKQLLHYNAVQFKQRANANSS